jgi:hypothetical protein
MPAAVRDAGAIVHEAVPEPAEPPEPVQFSVYEPAFVSVVGEKVTVPPAGVVV